MAETCTQLLRESGEPLYVRLRSQLTERGIDVQASVLATFFPDDADLEFGVVVTPESRVYEFDLRYGAGQLTKQVATATITRWQNRTDRWRESPSAQDVEAALVLVARG